MSFTTLTGSNSLLLTANIKSIIETFIKTHGDFGLEKLNADEVEYARIIETVQTMPFLADRRLVVVYSPSGNKELSEKIQNVLESVNDQTDLVFVESKFDKRSSLYKTLKKKTNFSEYQELDESGLVRWLHDTAKEQGGQISTADARYLVQRVGLNQLHISHELQKLLTYDPLISRATIDLLTEKTPTSTIFELLDAAFAGDQQRAMNIYQEQRRQKVEPAQILALLAWQLHVLAVVKVAGDKSVDVIVAQARLNPYVVRKSQSLAKNISLAQLKDIVARTLRLDIRLKRESVDADEAIQNLLISL